MVKYWDNYVVRHGTDSAGKMFVKYGNGIHCHSKYGMEKDENLITGNIKNKF
jgi:hypothetical protein